MRTIFGRQLLTAVVLGTAVVVSSFAYAAPANSGAYVSVQKQVTSSISWEKGSDASVEAEGIGLPPAGTSGTRASLLARRAAIVDAYRMLAETVNTVQLDAETTMEDLAITSDVVRTKVSALIKGARIVSEHANNDGSYSVRIAVPLYGVDGVAGTALPEIKSTLPAAAPSVSYDYTPGKDLRNNAAGYTGVIIDARGLGLESTFSPVVFDTNGRAVYGMRNIDKDYAIKYGMVGYARSVNSDSATERAGVRPLVLKAKAVRSGRNSANPVNVVISVDDADKLLYVNEKAGILDKRAVVFVK